MSEEIKSEDIKSFFQILKSNLTMFAVIPTFLGGIFQLIKLGNISVSMIRFFSISQLLIDGIIILMFFSIPNLFLPFIYRARHNKLLNADNNLNLAKFAQNYRFPKIWLSIVIFDIFVIIIALILFSFTDHLNFLQPYLFYFISFIIVFIQSMIFIQFYHFLKSKSLTKVYFIFSTMLSLVCSFYFLNIFYSKIDSIENFNYLITKLEKKDCYSVPPKIIYFNDKYIFIELDKKNKKSIVIKKIDDLFEQ